MIKEDFKNKKIAVLGFGVEGESVVNFLLANGASVFVVDVRNEDTFETKTVSGFRKRGVKFQFDSYPEDFSGYNLAVRSPGISSLSSVIERIKNQNVLITSATQIFFNLCPCPIIGVTGTKGKSTTSVLIYEMLKKQGVDAYLGGNVGKPPLDFLNRLKSDSRVVLELSSFQLQDLTKSPQIAVFLMVTSEHLDYHRDIGEYIDAKRNILRYQKESDYAIVNRDYPASSESDAVTHGQVYYISRERTADRGSYVKDDFVYIKLADSEEKVIPCQDILLPGKHNLENVCAASLSAYLSGVSMQNIATVLKEFKGLEHRLELVGEYRGIKFYNDSLATIPEAVIEGIEALGENVETLIAGGHDRSSDFTELGIYISSSKIKNLILFPTTGEKIWKTVCEAMPNGGLRPKKFDASSMKEAVLAAYEQTDPGKICLLSPGSASFGIFKNYKDRGDQFKKEVNALK